MKLHDLHPSEGSKKRKRRVGRGIAAGQGKTAGRGTKGQNARSGGGVRPYFEGGQLPLVRKLPFARGYNFFNPWKVEFQPVNLEKLAKYFESGDEISPETLAERGLIKHATDLVAVLGQGEVDHPYTVKAQRVSASARMKIEAAGGTVELLPWQRGGYRTR
ncbi:MAG: 50S ribosomal protein L15 [Anaerolineae bacterium]|nr:50S ribosomal protein L15 [Anaerolineae bacterium]